MTGVLMWKVGRWALAGLGVLGVLACGEPADDRERPAGPDATPDPSAWGPFPVGVQTWALVDESRGEDGPRPLVTEVWYPATDAALEGGTVTYRIEDILRADALALLDDEVEIELPTDAVRDAPVRLSEGPYPVVFFSHGSGGIRAQSTHLTVFLASHGYVVVSPDHHGNTLSDLLVDGGQSSEVLLQAFQDRPLDLDVVLEHLEALPSDDPLRAAVDLRRLGVAGHSFGALTSIRWMGLGAPVSAVVAQAPPALDLIWLGLSRPLADFDVPLMLHVGGKDGTTTPEDADSIWTEATAPRSRLTLANAGHFTFSDMCSLDPEAIVSAAEVGVPDAIREDCGPDRTPIELAASVVRHYAIAHFNAHLRDSPGSLALLTEAAGVELAGDEVGFEIEH
jgi:predicted dienelactone hydrolase